MASANVLEFTNDNFQDDVLNAGTPVLVDFWAEWCMPCRMLAPVIDQVADEYAGKVKVGKVDTDSNREISVQYEISAIPTVILFKNGAVVRKFVGLTNKADLAAAIEDALALAS
ncbi:MAG TPA: thioredoxin [Phycisphaerales bacterium]|nr:thioredoxin [Phycisphaerales bacterium]